ncbi:hypothetical protein QFZ30_002486 [Arthrobacter pascens]|uniref:hypothetical protein n=1 Tax=Arthrobacter pascens TaxID=1677 RepID=UPI0027932D83|nr:hypothetical protein [Arthrobacter pascens]MDQ0679104.1 hypothetical protein [Arthrobacter pascens]
MEDLESMRRGGAIRGALARAPGGRVTMLDPRPLVKVRVVYGRAVARTPTSSTSGSAAASITAAGTSPSRSTM